MKKIFLAIATFFLAFAIYAQPVNDNMPESLVDKIDRIARDKYSKIEEFKKWMRNNEITERVNSNHVLFRWPMRVNSNYNHIPNYYMIQNYVDQNRQNSYYKEWHCGYRTYDQHDASDINVYPFWWRMMDGNNVFACAAAPGIVIAVVDSINNDDNCMEPGENESGNHITILHSDSSRTIYYHIKHNTARVMIDEFVAEGTLLANIGSSGRSSNPHLHFAVRDKNNNIIEPFSPTPDAPATCNSLNEESWWQNQKPYFEPQINRVATHSYIPVIQGVVNSTNNLSFCRDMEFPRLKNQFLPTETVYVGVALHDVDHEDSLFFYIKDPSGNTISTVTLKAIAYNYPGRFTRSYRAYGYIIPASAITGTYKVEVHLKYKLFAYDNTSNTYNTTRYTHFFTVGCLQNKTLSGSVSGFNGSIVSNLLQSTQNITNGYSLYQSANQVNLKPGFRVAAGTVFKARIANCDYCD